MFLEILNLYDKRNLSLAKKSKSFELNSQNFLSIDFIGARVEKI